jgi:hypothetical protein
MGKGEEEEEESEGIENKPYFL